jgi:hypothetical protein
MLEGEGGEVEQAQNEWDVGRMNGMLEDEDKFAKLNREFLLSVGVGNFRLCSGIKFY